MRWVTPMSRCGSPKSFVKLIVDQDPGRGRIAKIQVYATHSKKTVVDTDTDLLTTQEYRDHAVEVSAAVHDELKTWIQHACFERRPRRGASNILDVRWVGKWKHVKDKLDPAKMNRVIRMRMT